jgi:hypothetical protein
MEKLLRFMYVIQCKRVRTGLGPTIAMQRLNPFNPISYALLLVVLLVGIVLFGIAGVWEVLKLPRIFKWK